MRRVTGTDLIHNIDAQSGGIVAMRDFVPMPHPHPNCVVISYMLMLKDGSTIPFRRIMPEDLYMEAIGSQFIIQPNPRQEEMLKQVIEHVYANEATVEKAGVVLSTLKAMLSEVYPPDREIEPGERLRIAQRYVKNIFIHNFMDDHSFDAAVLRKCTSMQVLPDGRMIPNCGYRVIHRPSDPRWQTHKERNPGHGIDGLRRQLTLIS